MKIYEGVRGFQKRYPFTLAFRTNEHTKIIEKHINPDEEVRYAFCGQLNNISFLIPNTFAIVLTNKRLLFARKSILGVGTCRFITK